MTTPNNNDVVEFVAALDQCGRTQEIAGAGLRFLCRQAARMIKDLRPDLYFEPIEPADQRSGESK